MLNPKQFTRCLSLVLVFAPTAIHAQESEITADDTVMMEAFNVTVYGGKIPIRDGFTGKTYEGDNQVVWDFANSFNKLLVGYHKHLVIEEIKHLKYRIDLGDKFEGEMNQLSAKFGFGAFTLDRSQWLTRERAIISRLMQKPFFKIESLVAWDMDRLTEMAPAKPRSKYADDIHFDEASGEWQRRITSRWNVSFPRNRGGTFFTHKDQGFNLDTMQGYHFIEQGLPALVPPNAFKDVKLTYPVFYSDNVVTAEELTRLQETFVANLIYIYDPFSWVARRDTRFRGGYYRDCLAHVQAERIPVNDRDWFDPVLARFLSDVIIMKLEGAEEIYDFHMVNKRISESPRALGTGLDLLNWNKGEKRKAVDAPEAIVQLNARSAWGFRYVLIDAHQRYGNALVDRLRARLLAQAEAKKKGSGRAIIEQIIAELSGLPFSEFAARAVTVQQDRLNQHRITG